MKSILLILSAICLVTVFISCKKSSTSQGPPPVFSWRMDNGAEQLSDTTSFLSLFGYNYIFGKKGTTSVFVSTNSTNPGTYSTMSASAAFGLTIAGTQYSSLSGTVMIISNSNRRLMGNYSAELINGNIDTVILSGTFSNIGY
ncbi:MAG TPA: hypothetical protein VIZ28_04825 [Chitinophagaceae bacterium]